MKKYAWISRLELFRQKYKLLQTDVAAITGYSIRHVKSIECGTYEMPLPMLKLIDSYIVMRAAHKTIDAITKGGDEIFKTVDKTHAVDICFSRLSTILSNSYAKKRKARKKVKK